MKNLMQTLLLIFLLWSSGSLALALDPSDVPAGPPNDAIMAAPTEMADMADWAAAAFAGHESQNSGDGRPRSSEKVPRLS